MKIAVCLSGICRGNVKRNLEHMRHQFNYDYFFATWKGREKDIEVSLPGEKYFTAVEPKMHYHPIIDVPNLLSPKLKAYMEAFKSGQYKKNMIDRTLNHTKQILAHAFLLEKIPNEYDMIIRARYDTFISKQVNLHKFIDESYTKKQAIGFGTRNSRHSNFLEIKEIPQLYPDGKKKISQDWGWYIMDPIIMHRRDMFNLDLVWKLHNEKKLLPAENGWYQILSEPYGDNHRCFYGGVQIEKYLKSTIY